MSSKPHRLEKEEKMRESDNREEEEASLHVEETNTR